MFLKNKCCNNFDTLFYDYITDYMLYYYNIYLHINYYLY